MTTMLIAQNETRESGSFMGDQLCSLKAAYLFVQNQPDVDRVIMSVSPSNEMAFLWERFIRDPRGDGTIPPVELIEDSWNPGDWDARFCAWNQWRDERWVPASDGRMLEFDHYRELYLRIHGAMRQVTLCGSERGLGRRNIFEYWYYGQEHVPESCVGSDVYDVEINHTPLTRERDVYVSPHCKTQGNITFTFDYWQQVVHKLIDSGVSVTVGYEGYFCEDLNGHPLYKKHWGSHRQWVDQVCQHKIVACGNTGTGWVAAACGVPLFTMEPPNSQMPDHRYRECGLRNIVEVMHVPDADYCAKRLIEEVQRCVVMTTGCFDILHSGHVRHLEKSRSLGTKLIVALNSDSSIRHLKGPTRPINPQNQRRAVLEALRCVDEVRVFDGDNAIPLIQEVKPQILTNGLGYSPSDVVGRDLVESWGGHVVITYNGDAKNEPSTTKIVKRVRSSDVIEAIRVGSQYSVNPFDKLRLMAEEFLKVADGQGEVADLGACRGGTAFILRKLAPEKQLHIFDTWEGTPYDDDLCHHKKGEWRADFKECEALVGRRYTFYWPGVFPKSAYDCFTTDLGAPETKRFCFVYVDMDTYQATKDALKFFWPRMLPGGIMFIDDYGWEPCAGVKKAVDEFFPPDKYGEYKDFDGVPTPRIIKSMYTYIVEK